MWLNCLLDIFNVAILIELSSGYLSELSQALAEPCMQDNYTLAELSTGWFDSYLNLL